MTSYWAAVPTDEIGEKLSAKLQTLAADQLVTTLAQQDARSYQYFYGLNPEGVHATSQVLRGGDEGELAEMRVNHARPLVNTLLNLIVAPKIVWSPKATNIDAAAIAECELAASILEYYWRDKQVSKHAVLALEDALVFREGFVLVEWDDSAGDDVLSDDGVTTTRAGDLRYTNISRWDVIRDPNKTSWDALDWVMVRLFRNRYDLAAQYPEQAEEIHRNAEDKKHEFGRPVDTGDSDDVAVYRFYHRRSAAIPTGRQLLCLLDGTVLEGSDTTLEFDDIPLYRVSAGELRGTPFGYSPFLDIQGVQELMDSLHTCIASNQSTFGTQSIAIQKGTEYDLEQTGGGMRIWEYPQDGKPPEALQLTKTPNEIFQYLAQLKKEQELLFGLNSVVRGEPQSGEMSGSALALLESQALQQSSTIQANYLRFVEGLGNCTIYVIQRKAKLPTKIAIVGKNNTSLVTETQYTGKSLGRIKKVQVEVGNPLSQTSAGRIEMAKDLLQHGFIKSPEQYLQVLTTGRLDPLTQSLSKELLLIRSENEQLMEGEVPPVFYLDDAPLHIREHRSVLCDPAVRRNPMAVEAVKSHIAMHEQEYFNASPQTLALAGVPPPQMPPPGAPPPGPDGPPGPPSPGGPQPEQPELPSLPKNPATGQQWDPVTGGGAVQTT